jgi:hypothetical protein
MAAVDAAIAAQEERIAKLETPTPPGSPSTAEADAAGAESPAAVDDKSKELLQAAIDFLRNPDVAKAPMSAKINYLHQKLHLGSAGIKVAVGMVYGRASPRSTAAHRSVAPSRLLRSRSQCVPRAEAAAAIVEKTLTKAAVEAAGVKLPPPAAPAPFAARSFSVCHLTL